MIFHVYQGRLSLLTSAWAQIVLVNFQQLRTEYEPLVWKNI